MSIITRLQDKALKAKSDPKEALIFLMSLIRGRLIKLKLAPFAHRIQIGARFRARASISIKGPGKVFIGNDVTADMSFLRNLSILTHTEESSITIGDGCYLGGTRISCVGRVLIGPEGLFGSTTIIDSDIIPTSNTLLDLDWIKKYTSPIQIGSHFWSGTNSFILKGSQLGDECVLGAGATIYEKKFPDLSLIIGNPGRRIGSTR
jgi:acetyltransferase-like isoleucine patch superfamily enzyme